MNKGSLILGDRLHFCLASGISNKNSGLIAVWAWFIPAPFGSNPTDS